jgi:hypothetical protein
MIFMFAGVNNSKRLILYDYLISLLKLRICKMLGFQDQPRACLKIEDCLIGFDRLGSSVPGNT